MINSNIAFLMCLNTLESLCIPTVALWENQLASFSILLGEEWSHRKFCKSWLFPLFRPQITALGTYGYAKYVHPCRLLTRLL